MKYFNSLLLTSFTPPPLFTFKLMLKSSLQYFSRIDDEKMVT